MATGGGQVPGKKNTVKFTSEEYIDYHCCVCERKNIQRGAEKYCLSCEDYYCQKCVKIHEDVPSMSEHVFLGKSQFKSICSEHHSPSVPTEKCADHPGVIVDMFCETHKEAGCKTCMREKHDTTCVKLYIPEHIAFLFDIEQIKNTEKQLRVAIQTVEAALSTRERSLGEMLKVVDSAGKQLEIYTDQLINIATELKQKTQDRLDFIRNEFESVLSKQTNFLEKVHSAARGILQKTTHANSKCNNKSQQIVCSRLAAMATKKCEGVNKSLDCPDVGKISFQPHMTCQELFNMIFKYNSLGEFILLPRRKQTVNTPCKSIQTQTATVKGWADKLKCHLSGSCTFQNGTILLADYNNGRLKRLSPPATSASDCLQLPGRPWSVVLINQVEAAVTLSDLKQVHIIALGATMKTTGTILLDFECRAITYSNNELFISDKKTVYVYTVPGKLLRYISRDKAGHTLFSYIHNMAVGEDGRLLFIADWQEGLVTVERRTGRMVWRYSEKDLRRATGVCVDGRGSVFVCGCFSDNIIQLSESGEKIGEIVIRAGGNAWPQSVCFDADLSNLVVTLDGNVVLLKQLKTS